METANSRKIEVLQEESLIEMSFSKKALPGKLKCILDFQWTLNCLTRESDGHYGHILRGMGLTFGWVTSFNNTFNSIVSG